MCCLIFKQERVSELESTVAGLEAERAALEKIRDDQMTQLSAEREEKNRIRNELSKYKTENTTEEQVDKESENSEMNTQK